MSRYTIDRSAALPRPRRAAVTYNGTVAIACLIIAVAIAIVAVCTDPTADLPAQPYERTVPQ